MPFVCTICEEESTQICARCTKDACSNHLCERCRRCSDCCECEISLQEPQHESARTVLRRAAEEHAVLSTPEPDPEPEPPLPPPGPDPLPPEEPEPGPIAP